MSVDIEVLYELIKNEFMFLNVVVVVLIALDLLISIIRMVMERWKK